MENIIIRNILKSVINFYWILLWKLLLKNNKSIFIYDNCTEMTHIIHIKTIYVWKNKLSLLLCIIRDNLPIKVLQG